MGNASMDKSGSYHVTMLLDNFLHHAERWTSNDEIQSCELDCPECRTSSAVRFFEPECRLFQSGLTLPERRPVLP